MKSETYLLYSITHTISELTENIYKDLNNTIPILNAIPNKALKNIQKVMESEVSIVDTKY